MGTYYCIVFVLEGGGRHTPTYWQAMKEEEMPIFSNIYYLNPWGDSFIAVQSD